MLLFFPLFMFTIGAAVFNILLSQCDLGGDRQIMCRLAQLLAVQLYP